jgi:hypothetical protein
LLSLLLPCRELSAGWSVSSKTMPKKDYRWQIYHIKETPAKFIGTVTALDEERALKKAVSELEIDPKVRNRIVALRQG